jgi:D-alanyl-D-alanine carboxypeptidase
MKQFFTIVFGGLGAIIFGIIIAYGGSFAWHALKPQIAKISGFSFSKVASTIVTPSDDGTSISGTKRTIRYTASEEEDLLNSVSQGGSTNPDTGILTASAYLLKNLTTDEVTTVHNSDRLFPIASLTKLATAVVARRLIDPDERITVGKNVMATYGNTAGFQMGETFKASDLLYPLLMVSSNDSAEALAMAYDRPKFISAMNEWAQSIGAYRTYFADASGLSAANVSTVHDMGLMIDWIRKNDPAIIETTALKSKTIRSHTWVNPTHFLSWSYYIGGKNGYTTEANRTGVSLFNLGKNGNIYVAVVLGSSNRDADVVKLLGKVRE